MDKYISTEVLEGWVRSQLEKTTEEDPFISGKQDAYGEVLKFLREHKTE